MKKIYSIPESVLRYFTLFLLLQISVVYVYAQSTNIKFDVQVVNSFGEPQTDVFLKLKAYSQTYHADSVGVIHFEKKMYTSYLPKAYIYFNYDKEKSVKEFSIHKDSVHYSFRIDGRDDISRFKQENMSIAVEGILHNEDGEPVVNASIGLQGTGKSVVSDEIGLFCIEMDYNHPLLIRASGMETITVHINRFLTNQDEAPIIVMRRKGNDKIYNVVDEMPQYRGGMKRFMRYLENKTRYTDDMKKMGIEGVVVMQFVVEKDGAITHPRIVRPLHAQLDAIAYNAIKDMPRWIPGTDGGSIVRCRYSVPVSFKMPPPPAPAKPQMVVGTDSLKCDSLCTDSISLTADSLLMADSLANIYKVDSLLDKASLTLAADSVAVTDSIAADTQKVQPKVKVKKRPNAFIRFFRRLFGIKRDRHKKADTIVVEKKEKADAPVEADMPSRTDEPFKEPIADNKE